MDAPRFADLGLPDAMSRALAARAITTPTPIQAATIPDALDGRDVCGKAPTGSGKTIAFGVPIVLRVERAKPHRPRGLVLAPTRELAAQISQELQLLAKPKGPWVEAFYGGVGFDRQFKALARGVDIAVACPGRLADLVQQRQVDLHDVDLVVIDEADRMADMGFLPEVKRLLDACAPDRQTLLFSATLDGDVDVLIRRYQRDPIRHEHVVDESNDDVTHLFWSVERPRRISTIAKLVADNGPTVVFCRTKRGADRVARQLGDAGVKAAAIHGDRSQSQRDRALRAFRSGDVAALVATDVAARGIHVDDVGCVVHYDLPADAKAYIHRSGRTGRAGALGLVVSVVPAELARDAAVLQRELGYPKGLTSPDGANARPAQRPTEPAQRPTEPAQRPTEPAQRESRPSHRDARPATREKRPPRRATRPAPREVETVEPVQRDEQIFPSPNTTASPRPNTKNRPSGAARRKAKREAAQNTDTVASLADATRRGSSGSARGSSRRRGR
jgi:superfamily II DNA/RNA helicase